MPPRLALVTRTHVTVYAGSHRLAVFKRGDWKSCMLLTAAEVESVRTMVFAVPLPNPT